MKICEKNYHKTPCSQWWSYSTYGFKLRPTQLPGTHLSGEELSGKSWTLGRPNKGPRNPKCMWQQKPRKLLNQNPKQVSSIYRERERRTVRISYLISYNANVVSLTVFLLTRSSPPITAGTSRTSQASPEKLLTKTAPRPLVPNAT